MPETSNTAEAASGPKEKKVNFFVLSRSDAWIDQEATCVPKHQVVPFDINDDAVLFEEEATPDFMRNWRLFKVLISKTGHSRFFSDLSVCSDVFGSLPDIFRLNRWVHVSCRVKDLLCQCGLEQTNFAPVQIWSTSNLAAVTTYYVMITQTVFYHSKLDEQGNEPDVDYDSLIFRTPLNEIQNNPRIVDYLSEKKLWSLFPSYEIPYFSAELFRLLKDSDVSGLEEKKTKYSLTYDGQEAFGHVYG